MKFRKVVSAVCAAVMGISSLSAAVPAFAADVNTLKSVVATSTVPKGYVGIYDLNDLEEVRDNLDGKYILMKDVSLSNENWEPIGEQEKPFTGVFDGNGYTIDNLTYQMEISESAHYNIGLFGVTDDAVITNLAVTNVDIDINDTITQIPVSVGVVAGSISTTHILNCSSSGNIDLVLSGDIYAGGIVGEAVSSEKTFITNCLNETKITVEAKSDYTSDFPVQRYTQVGGIIGMGNKQCPVTGSINKGSINVTDRINLMRVGGIAGSIEAAVTNCGNIGEINVNGLGYAGGICGSGYTIENSYNSAKVTMTGNSNTKFDGFGGIAGSVNLESASTYSMRRTVAVNGVVNCYYTDANDKSVHNTDEGVILSVKALTEDEMIQAQSYDGFDFENVWMASDGSTPTIKSDINKIETSIEILENEYYAVPFELLSINSNNPDIAVIENGQIKGVSSGTTSVEILTSDGQFEIIEVTVPGESDDTDNRSILGKIADFFKSIFQVLFGFIK